MTHDRISLDPNVMVGKPVITGTRIPVDLLLRLMSGGWSIADLVEAYPHISADDARAALLYASELARAQRRPGDDGAAWTPKT